MTYSFEPNQIVIIAVFLLALVGLMVLARKFKGPISQHRTSQRRINLIEDTALSPTERVKLVTINQHPYAIFTTKGQQPVVVPVEPEANHRPTVSSKPAAGTAQNSASAAAPASGDAGGSALKKPFLQAMKQAQARNPLLGLDK